MFRIFLNINSISSYSFRSIANQNGVRYSDSTSYFKKYSSSKCKQTVCLHYGLDFHFKYCQFKYNYHSCCKIDAIFMYSNISQNLLNFRHHFLFGVQVKISFFYHNFTDKALNILFKFVCRLGNVSKI
jgi:hypothetical protein